MNEEEPAVAKELRRRRAFAFLAVVLLPEVIYFLSVEIGELQDAMDCIVYITAMVVVLAIILTQWNKRTLPQLKRQHNVILAAVIIAIVFELAAFAIEFDDPTAIGDEPSSIVALALMLANRFI